MLNILFNYCSIVVFQSHTALLDSNTQLQFAVYIKLENGAPRSMCIFILQKKHKSLFTAISVAGERR